MWYTRSSRQDGGDEDRQHPLDLRDEVGVTLCVDQIDALRSRVGKEISADLILIPRCLSSAKVSVRVVPESTLSRP